MWFIILYYFDFYFLFLFLYIINKMMFFSKFLTTTINSKKKDYINYHYFLHLHQDLDTKNSYYLNIIIKY